MDNQLRHSKHQGFTLIELLIAILIASLSVLGLAYTQNKSLQYARSSSQYTLASIEASNAVEQIWASLCTLDDGDELDSIITIADGFDVTFDPTTFKNEMTVSIDWNDQRLKDDDDDDYSNVTVAVVFPDISSNTTLCP